MREDGGGVGVRVGSKKEYKERTDNISPTRSNKAVRIATLLLNIYLIETKGQPSHPSLQMKLAGK